MAAGLRGESVRREASAQHANRLDPRQAPDHRSATARPAGPDQPDVGKRCRNRPGFAVGCWSVTATSLEAAMSEPLLSIRNHHAPACGDPPIVRADDTALYVGYFENAH